jgi:YVTN family beta-propeller protein
VAGRDVWVISNNQRQIARLDVESGQKLRAQPRVGRGAAAIAADRDAVWVAHSRRGQLLRLDARDGRVTERINTPLRPVLVAAGPSGLWVVGRSDTKDGPDLLLRYERDGGAPLWQLEVFEGVRAIALGRGAGWLALRTEARIRRVTPDGTPSHGAFLSEPASHLAYGAGHLWASVPADDSVVRVDPDSGQTRSRDVGSHPADIAVAGKRVYVASQNDDTVVVLDPRTQRREGEPREVGVNPHALAAADGHVWVTGVGDNTLTRIDY